ncbi:hypothetical protein [Nodularia sp. NIES-3585]|nr:hypothetical protein [Nodularia sp. NIES-3585]
MVDLYKFILYNKKYEKGDRPLGRVCDRLSLNPTSGVNYHHDTSTEIRN